MMQPSHSSSLQEIINSERRFFANDYQGEDYNPHTLIIAGSQPILVASPHAVQHLRNATIKKAEAMTGTIATQLSTQTKTHAFIQARSNDQDPNYDPAGTFKSKLAQYVKRNDIRFIINLHGMNEKHGCDIVLGSGFGQTINHRIELLEASVEALAQSGFNKIYVDNPSLFPANNPHNLSQYSYRELNIPSFQIEISYLYRNPIKHPDKYNQLIFGLDRMVNQLALYI